MAEDVDKKIAELEALLEATPSHMKRMDIMMKIQKLKDMKDNKKNKKSWEM